MNFAIKTTQGTNVVPTTSDYAETAPVIIIGSGPVGVRAAQQLLSQCPEQKVIIYGDEPCEPYNRVQLSTFLHGSMNWFDLTRDQKLPENDEQLVTRFNCAITHIDREKMFITDQYQRIQYYSKLIIATGSRPRIPGIRGVNLKGVHSFRDLNDAKQLIKRRNLSKRTVVIGGGLLGLEAAYAMLSKNNRVHVIDHSIHLMHSQLDEAAAELLREHLLSLGIQVHLQSSVKEIIGQQNVEAVVLRNDMRIQCDTIVLATGIQPNIEIARNAGLVIGRGIRVDDRMQTSDNNIYAIGECAEHRKIVYGLVAPGFEQAKVAVYSIRQSIFNAQTKKQYQYKGSVTSTSLKVLDINVFSMGQTKTPESKGLITYYYYRNEEQNCYRKLVIKRGRIIAAIAVGEWEQIGRIQEAITHKRYIWPWQINAFILRGYLWSGENGENISEWPASTKICNCIGVTRGEITAVIKQGCASVEQIAACTGASTVCGSCKPKLAELMGSTPVLEKDIRSKSITISSLVALCAAAILLFAPKIYYAESVQVNFQWDLLWRDSTLKQITGYTALGFLVIGALLSFRKRITYINFIRFENWRLIHIVTSLIAVFLLFAHTGFRLGNNINQLLMSNMLILVFTGIATALIIGIQHKIDYVSAKNQRSWFTWAHIIFLWPIPIFLGFHIIKTYYY